VFVDRVKLLDPLFRDGRMGRLPLVDVAFAARMMNEQGAELALADRFHVPGQGKEFLFFASISLVLHIPTTPCELSPNFGSWFPCSK
jgi:hypothetical protein